MYPHLVVSICIYHVQINLNKICLNQINVLYLITITNVKVTVLLGKQLWGGPKMRKGLLFAQRTPFREKGLLFLRKGLLLWLKLFIRVMFDL